MTLKKENAAPDVVVGAATGQHLCNSEISIPNAAPAGNEKIAVPEAHQGSNSVTPNPDLIESGAAEDIEKNLEKSSLQEVSMTELYDRVYEPKTPVVEGILYPGTYIFAGSPKVGKSFFMAQLAYHVAAGIPLWEYPVRQGSVLYLALEDDYARLQKRLSRMFDVEGTDSLYLATDARSMADGLEAQMEQFITRHPDTVLIIIDTLQRIRELSGEQYSYAKDYEVIKSLKAFADKHGICFLIVHHTRKMEAEDSFDMISGTNGLLGAADGAFVLFVSAETEPWKEPPDPVLEAVSGIFTDNTIGYEGPASMLLEDLKKIDPNITIAANSLGRKLNVSAERLFNEYGIRYESTRSHFGRCIKLTKMKPKEETEKKE